MPKLLSIANKLLSLRGQIDITDDQGNSAYVAKGEFAFFSPTWRITAVGKEVAQIRRKILSWTSTWLVSGELGEFAVKSKYFSWTRQYYFVGGEYEAATIKGNFWGLQFEVRLGDDLIAQATGKILTLRDRQQIEILAEPELLTVIAMVIVHLDRRDEQQRAKS